MEARNIPLEQIKVKTENNILEGPELFGCEFCERSFLTYQGRKIHTSKMHKQKLWNQNKISHNTDFNLERKESVTKLPPAKKPKETTAQIEEVNTTQINKEKDPKDEENLRLYNVILQLKNGLLCKESNSVKQPEALDPIIHIIEVTEVEEIPLNHRPVNQPHLMIGKNRQKTKHASEKNVSICSHRQEIVVEDIPEFEHICKKCGKGFREKANLVRHMSCHTQRFCECKFPCVPIKAPEDTHRGLASSVAPEVKGSEPNHSQDDQECHMCEDSNQQSQHKTNVDSQIRNKHFAFSYNCKHCGKGFSQKSNLDKHKRSHLHISGTKTSATCLKCNKSYQNEQQLSYHMNKEHINQQAYPCKHCENVFETKEAQQEHNTKNHFSKEGKSKKVTFSEVNSCPNCEHVFKTKTQLEEHLDTEHMDTEQNQTLELQAPAPVVENLQFHCALNNTPECLFQCNSKGELDQHIEKHHNKKTWLQCSVCQVYFRDLDALAQHMNMAHKKENNNQTKCSKCELSFSSKEELELHLKDHQSYKPCRNFGSNNCEFNEDECSFRHIILEQNQQICYKCGSITTSKTELMKHIKEEHGSELCHKFLENKCTFGSRCLFTHIISPVQNVDRVSTPARHTMKDFPNTLTTEPVVRPQGRPQNVPPAPLWSQICQQDQNPIQALTTQVMLMMNQMNQIQTMLTKINGNPQ